MWLPGPSDTSLPLRCPKHTASRPYSREQLPIIPDPFRLVVRQIRKGTTCADDPSALKQLGIIRKCFDRSDRIIVATDAGREGELIFRLIYAYLDCRKPFRPPVDRPPPR